MWISMYYGLTEFNGYLMGSYCDDTITESLKIVKVNLFDNDVDYVSPTKETFDEIKFTMSNGKSFVICADDAEVDGYALVWSEDTDETITEK